MSSIITAEHLRSLHAKRKHFDLDQTIDLITQEYVIPAAEAGETSILLNRESYPSKYHLGYNIKYQPSLPDVVNALEQRFPDVFITVISNTTIRDDGVFEKNSRILMDWSVKETPG
jgi:hypothetical protein